MEPQQARSTLLQSMEAVTCLPDAEALAALYERYFPKVYAYLRYRLPSTMDAEDATAAVFERALSALHSFRSDEARFGAWLLHIARNIATDHYRRQAREERHLVHETLGDVAGGQASAEEQVVAGERFQRLQAHLRTLPERDQEIIALKFGYGLTNRHIAQVLNMNESTVGSALYASMRRLRSQLQEEGYGV